MSWSLLGGLSPAEFLDRYWQKRPLLVRGAWPRPSPRLSPEELAGLALEEDVESRVVMGDTESQDWTLLHGPFDDAFFSDMPDRDWTLLVQDVDKHLPAFAELLAPLRFVADWRIDDLMISYAAPGGTVGPHLDRYDVFLLQTEGRRRWQIQHPAPATEQLREDSPLRLLADFAVTEQWSLEPGDMLYLPPGVPHYGVALEAGMTYSIGFRAPFVGELLQGWATECASHTDESLRYTDPDLRPQANPGEIPPATLARLRETLRRHLLSDDLTMDRWLGRFLTEPKAAFADVSPAQTLDVAQLEQRLGAGDTLRHNPAVRTNLIRYDDDQMLLYAHAREYRLGPDVSEIGERLTSTHRVTANDLSADPRRRHERLALLTDWYNQGVVLFDDPCTEED